MRAPVGGCGGCRCTHRSRETRRGWRDYTGFRKRAPWPAHRPTAVPREPGAATGASSGSGSEATMASSSAPLLGGGAGGDAAGDFAKLDDRSIVATCGIASLVVLIASTSICTRVPNSCHDDVAWGVACSTVSLFLCLAYCLAVHLKVAVVDAAKAPLACFLFVWWIPGVIVLTAPRAPFSVAGNGFFGAWAALFSAGREPRCGTCLRARPGPHALGSAGADRARARVSVCLCLSGGGGGGGGGGPACGQQAQVATWGQHAAPRRAHPPGLVCVCPLVTDPATIALAQVSSCTARWSGSSASWRTCAGRSGAASCRLALASSPPPSWSRHPSTAVSVLPCPMEPWSRGETTRRDRSTIVHACQRSARWLSEYLRCTDSRPAACPTGKPRIPLCVPPHTHTPTHLPHTHTGSRYDDCEDEVAYAVAVGAVSLPAVLVLFMLGSKMGDKACKLITILLCLWWLVAVSRVLPPTPALFAHVDVCVRTRACGLCAVLCVDGGPATNSCTWPVQRHDVLSVGRGARTSGGGTRLHVASQPPPPSPACNTVSCKTHCVSL